MRNGSSPLMAQLSNLTRLTDAHDVNKSSLTPSTCAPIHTPPELTPSCPYSTRWYY